MVQLLLTYRPLQKCDNLQTTSSKMMYKTTDSHDLKLKMERSVSVSLKLLHKSKEQFITNLDQWDACGRGFSDTHSFLNTSVSGSKLEARLSSSISSTIQFLFLDLTCFVIENICALTHVCVSKDRV